MGTLQRTILAEIYGGNEEQIMNEALNIDWK